MSESAPHSEDQARAFGALSQLLKSIDSGMYCVTGKAGSGKTRLLSDLFQEAKSLDFRIIEPDFERKADPKQRSLAILTPTNKASAVLRARGVPATTLHRILYRPIYHPEYEAIADWLTEGGTKPVSEMVESEALDRAKAFYDMTPSVPSALAIIGARGSDFIKGWKRRDEVLDIGFVDESSMLDTQQIEDLQEIFNTLVLFGDPAQLAPIGKSEGMVFEQVKSDNSFNLSRIHRQVEGNPILDLAHALADPTLEFGDFQRLISEAALKDDRVVVSERVDTDLMARSPVLVWRNATRKRLIAGFRRAHAIEDGQLRPGEPLICDGIELPMKHRAKRIDLETRGLIKGAQSIFLGQGNKSGFARLYVMGAADPFISVASIIQIEHPDKEEPDMVSAAKMGASFLHGAASTIHKAQGSQWPQVQVFGPDIGAAARSGRNEAGIPLWKRLVYVALTRAEHRFFWITDYKMAKPTKQLDPKDVQQDFELKLSAE